MSVSTSHARSSVSVCLGTMEFGRYASEEQAKRMTEMFLSCGYTELDTAFMYCDGESERIIGRFPASILSRCQIHTKANPWNKGNAELKGLTPSSVLTQCRTSLTSLHMTPSPSSPPVDIFYLHAPDPSTPLLDTLTAVNDLHRQGAFRRFGLSNYSSWQVMEIYQLCARHHFVLPSVYQGMYNAITRAVEPELFPLLSHLSIAFYAYNPLAGGILSGKYQFDQPPTEPGRYAGNDWADAYKLRYWKKSLFDAIEGVKQQLKEGAGGEAGAVTLTEASLRWLRHHSGMKGERGDCIILGASKEEQLEMNLRGVEGGPLPEGVVKALDRAWQECKAECPPYFR